MSSVTLGLAVGYVVLYGGYDKATQQYKIADKLKQTFSFKSPAASAVELNKVVGLLAMSVANAAALSGVAGADKAVTRTLLRHAVALSAAHGVFSAVQYSQRLFSGPISKRAAMVLGPLSLWATFFFAHRSIAVAPGLDMVLEAAEATALLKRVSTASLSAAAMLLITTHVYLMERKPGRTGVNMRPAGVWGLLTSAIVSVMVLGSALV